MNCETLSIRWHSHSSEVPVAAWDLDGARQAGLSLSYLRTLQDSSPGFVKSWHYATAHTASPETDRVVGLLVAFVLEARDEELLGPEPLRNFVLSDPMGMCRPPLIVAGDSTQERSRIRYALLDSAIERARGEQAEGVHVYWIGEGEDALRQSLIDQNFVEIPEDPCAHVPLLRNEIGAHLEALRGSYRNVLKRKRQQLATLGLSLHVVATRPDAALLDALYRKVAERKEAERWEIIESRFSLLFFELAALDSAFRLIVCEKPGGALLGFLLGLHSGDTFVSLAVGLDYDRIDALNVPGLTAAIFSGLHAEALAQAQAEGARWAVLGITALEGKARVGALCERNFGMGLGLTERARAVLRIAQTRVPTDDLPACRPYPDAALAIIVEAAARRGIRFSAPGSPSDLGPDSTST